MLRLSRLGLFPCSSSLLPYEEAMISLCTRCGDNYGEGTDPMHRDCTGINLVTCQVGRYCLILGHQMEKKMKNGKETPGSHIHIGSRHLGCKNGKSKVEGHGNETEAEDIRICIFKRVCV